MKVSDLLYHLAKSSLTQCQSAWKRLQDWLPGDDTEISVSLVARFLVHCHQKFEARTVLTIRAGLSLPLSEESGIDFDHRHSKMLAKAAFRKRPPASRVVPSWSWEDALRALARKRISPSDKLSRFIRPCSCRHALALTVPLSGLPLIIVELLQAALSNFSSEARLYLKSQAQFHAPSLFDTPVLRAIVSAR